MILKVYPQGCWLFFSQSLKAAEICKCFIYKKMRFVTSLLRCTVTVSVLGCRCSSFFFFFFKYSKNKQTNKNLHIIFLFSESSQDYPMGMTFLKGKKKKSYLPLVQHGDKEVELCLGCGKKSFRIVFSSLDSNYL